MSVTVDTELSDFDIQVYNWVVRSIRETGVPMRQAMIANKLRCARATVRAALIELDRRGYITFTRFKPQATALTDPARILVNDPDAPLSKHQQARLSARAEPAPANMPRARMPWQNG